MIKDALKKSIGLGLCGFLLACSPSYEPPTAPSSAEETPGDELPPAHTAFVEIAKAVMPTVVHISAVYRVEDIGYPFRLEERKNGWRGFFQRFLRVEPKRVFKQESLGSGFLIHRSGYILTNDHVVSDADEITVQLFDMREFDAKVVGSDPKADLALLRISTEEDLPTSPMGDSSSLEVGEWAIAVGNPFGLDRTVTVGVISATGRHGLYKEVGFIQTDASIHYGNSGGPLLNVRGEVIGINTAVMSSGQGIGFAVPINRAKQFAGPLIKIQ